MKKLMKKYFAILMTLSLFLINGASVANAASDHLLIANSKKNTMAYYVNNKFVKEFRIATGKPSTPTPQGKFQIVNKIKNRPYYTGGIPGGSPNNPLGDRWLGLNVNGTMGTIYGLHGNNNESSIGKHISGGCVRMHNSDVRWLFDQIPLKSYMIIKYTDDSYKEIAAKYGISVENPQPEKKPGWEKVGNDWYYIKDDKTYHKNGWLKIKDQWYYFNDKGIMQVGWEKVRNNWYYLREDGTMKTGWLKDNGSWYYLREDGTMKTGWLKDNGSWYYLREDGIMKTGWLLDKDQWYYLREDGTMKTGWLLDNDNWYYFLEEGNMKTGWRLINDNWYYFNKDGSMAHDTIIDDWTINSDGIAISPEV